MRVLELTTGLFPDAAPVAEAVQALEATHEVARADARATADDDAAGWEALAEAILGADLVITL